jgi:ABC transporter with metal-binding/Fe-S-binding domain ATP-binding protein
MQGWNVVSLVTVIPESRESWMFHYPAVKWTKLQAEAVGIPRTVIQTRGAKEDELGDLRSGLLYLIKSTGIEGIVSGAIASEYQRTRLDNLCEELGLRSFTPLWHKDQQELVREQVESGFQIIITACSALGLTANWLGRKLDQASVEELIKLNQKYGLSIAFEGGEAETFVLGGPMFNGTIEVVRSHPNWTDDSGYLELQELHLKLRKPSSLN